MYHQCNLTAHIEPVREKIFRQKYKTYT